MKLISTTGVGINNSDPHYALDVVGDINFTGKLRINGVEVDLGNISSVDGSVPAAQNLRKFFDGTGYDAATSRIGYVDNINGANLDVPVSSRLSTGVDPPGVTTLLTRVDVPVSTRGTSNFNATTDTVHINPTDVSNIGDSVVHVKPSAELNTIPGNPAELLEMIQFLYQYFRNLRIVTKTPGNEIMLKEDGTTVIGTASLSDDGTTFIKGKIG